MSATPMLSQLPDDLLVEIAKRLKKLEDFLSFKCVSKSLFAAAAKDYFQGLPFRHQLPYLMLPVRDDGDDDDVRELYSLADGESIVSSVKIPNLKTKKCFESLGWLLVVAEDGSMSLLDPFLGTEILVPHQRTCPGFGSMDEHIMIQKMVLSARPSETPDFVLMVICGGLGHLAFWRLGDKAWNTIRTRRGRFRDVVYDGDTKQFYATGGAGFVWAINLANYGRREEGRVITCCESVLPANPSWNMYILKTIDDALLFITRTAPRTAPDLCEGNFCYMTKLFEVYKVDKERGTYEEIDSLGNMAVFLGENSSISVDAYKFPGGVIKPNHIYFTDDDWQYYYPYSPKGGGMDIGIYNMEEGTVESIYPGEPLFSRVSPSIWITPSPSPSS